MELWKRASTKRRMTLANLRQAPETNLERIAMGRWKPTIKRRMTLANLRQASETNFERAAEEELDIDENVTTYLPAKRISTNESDEPTKKRRLVTKTSSKAIPSPASASSSRVQDQEKPGGHVVLRAVPQPASVHYPLQPGTAPADSLSVNPYYRATSNERVLLAALREQEARTRMVEQRNLELVASNAVQETYNKQLRAQLEEQQKKIAMYEELLCCSSVVPHPVVDGDPDMTPTSQPA